jgi:hypothetical protein
MTNDMMTLRTLLEKSSDTDLLREMLLFLRRIGPTNDDQQPHRIARPIGSRLGLLVAMMASSLSTDIAFTPYTCWTRHSAPKWFAIR